MLLAPQVRPLNVEKPITTVEELQDHLYHAIQVEFSTIPLYLYPAYSVQTQGYSQWSPGMSAFRTIRSVVIEEMLHLCLARNLLVAVGGGDTVRFYDEKMIPTYPSDMLHRTPTLELHLEPCTQSLMTEVFMPLELPAKDHAPPQGGEYNTLGQFYAAIRQGFDTLDKELGPDLWANNRPDLQYYSGYWNQDGGGSPIVVCDLTTAHQAIDTIVEQGEGSRAGDDHVPLDPAVPQLGLDELSHYAKFHRIAEGIDLIGTTWPVPTDPVTDQFDGSTGDLARFFDAAYCYVLCLVDAIYQASRKETVANERSRRYGLERTFIAAMGGVLYPIANLLVRQPVADGEH
ncbi:MAG: ferritin-like protein, partial [Actinomycetota bacterium]|nr:ferritin-like protein [Actinomycetota bacterium]